MGRSPDGVVSYASLITGLTFRNHQSSTPESRVRQVYIISTNFKGLA